MSQLKAYAIGQFRDKKFELFGDKPTGVLSVFNTREKAERELRTAKINGFVTEPIVVQVSIKVPKYKEEMTLEEIEKALGKRIIIVN